MIKRYEWMGMGWIGNLQTHLCYEHLRPTVLHNKNHANTETNPSKGWWCLVSSPTFTSGTFQVSWETWLVIRSNWVGNGRFCNEGDNNMMVMKLDCQAYINFGSRINPITEFGSIPWDIHGRCGAENQSPKDGKLERPYLGAVRTTEDPARLSKIDLSHFIKLFPRMTENISHAHLTLVWIWNNV